MPDVGKQSIQPSASELAEGGDSTGGPEQKEIPGSGGDGVANKDISVAQAGTQKKIGQETGTSGEYVSNMVAMIIDS